MVSPFPWLRRAPLLCALALPLSFGAIGCHGAERDPNAPTGEAQIAVTEVSEDDFGPALHRILRDGSRSPDRLSLLVGVVRRQLAHSARRFGKGRDARATDGVIGALHLVRTGEARAEMVDATGEKALGGAIERISTRGEEGRAQVLLRMRSAALPQGSKEKAIVDEHLASLEGWMKETHAGPNAIRRAGSDERTAVSKALIDSSEASIVAAVSAVNGWIAQGIEFNLEFRRTRQRPDRDDYIEATKALQFGGVTMATLFLRNGDAKGALDALDQTGARRVIVPELYAAIKKAASSDGQRDWLVLAAEFAHQEQPSEERELDMDPEMLASGVWGTALEAYRRDPTNLDAAMLLSRSLIRFGMPEATPLVLADAAQKQPDQATLSAVMEVVGTAISMAADLDDAEAARRSFKASAPILALADKLGRSAHVEPSPARVRFMMAAIEVRAGNLAEARPLLERAVSDDPSASGFTTLAQVERQSGSHDAALKAVGRALAAPDASASPVDVAEAHLVAFEVHREKNSAAAAKTELDAALASALAARQKKGGDAASHVRAERVLGRVLEAYGEAAGANRAYDRALAAAESDRPQLGAAMLDVIGRALVRKDVKAARAALKRGIEGDVSEDDLVYGGVWVGLLERELKTPPDGITDRALRGGRSGWSAKLTAWAHGKLSDADLSTAAQSPSQKVEAAFYTAMARRVAGDPTADQKLRAVASSPVLDLLEVQIARDLTAPRLQASLPGNVKVP